MKKSFTFLFLLSLLTVFGSLSVKADEVLYFTWTSVDGSNNILDGTFSFSGPQYDAVKNHGSNWIGFSKDAYAVTRQTYALQAGTHTFVLKTKWTENKSDQKLPKIQIGDATPVTLPNADYTGDDVKDLSYSITIGSSGNYKIKVIVQDGERDKFHIQSLTIPSSAFAPTFAVTATATNGSVTGIGSYVAGATVTLTPNPNPYYAFSSWSELSGITIAGYEDDNPLTFTMPAGAVSVIANFVSSPCTNTKTIQCEDYDNSYTPGSAVPGTLTTDTESGHAHDDFPAYHGSAYVFFGGSSGEVYYPVVLPASTYTFSVICANGQNKYLCLYDSEGTKIHDHKLTNDDWYDPWKTETTSAWTLEAGTYYIGLYANNNWAAFDQITITASTNVFCNYTITMADGVNGGKPTSDVASAAEGATVTVTAGDPESGYYFSGWSASPSVTFSASTSPATFTMPASNVTITANYSEIISSTFTYTTSGSGSITCLTASDASVASGTEISMTAVPSSEYVFKGWTAMAGSFSDPYALTTTFTMPAEDAEVTATFAQVDNKIIIGDVASTEGFDGDGNGTMNITTEADFDAFGHNVLKFAYSDMDDGKYKGRKIRINDGYSPASSAGATGFGFYYKTEKADDNVAFCFEVSSGEQVKWELQATNNEWKYFYFPHAGANSWNGGHIVIFMNGDDTGNYSTWDKQGTHTTYKNGGAFYMSEIAATTITSKPEIANYHYTNNRGGEMQVNEYGTLCLPMGGTIAGATLYSVAGKETGDISYLVLEDQGTNVVAGKPYITQSTATSYTVTMNGAYSAVQDGNGLEGTYELINLAPYDETHHNYFLYANAFKKAGTGVTVGAYRAYLNWDEVSAPAPAPSARRIRMVIEGQEVQTGIETVTAMPKTTKVLIDGQLFIIREGKRYTLTGARAQ